ncbi:hypothetical protein WA026_000964, partial [Henosepilachna vigintioctopunctata]
MTNSATESECHGTRVTGATSCSTCCTHRGAGEATCRAQTDGTESFKVPTLACEWHWKNSRGAFFVRGLLVPSPESLLTTTLFLPFFSSEIIDSVADYMTSFLLRKVNI